MANPTPGAQIAACLWNPDYTPELNWPEPNKDLPVVGVNWCEAYAFCEWSGKRLCGQIGGGASPYASYADASANQWFNGCSAQGNNAWPYGNGYDADSCNGADFGAAESINPACSGGPPGCAPCYGGAPALRQMSGNVSEWEDSCDGSVGAADSCRVRGGSYESDSAGLRCDANASSARNHASATIGFRCCF